MFGIYLPHAVYETMPYGYMLFGALSLVSLAEVLPRLLGLLLVWVGVAVVRMRTQYRRNQYAHPHAH